MPSVILCSVPASQTVHKFKGAEAIKTQNWRPVHNVRRYTNSQHNASFRQSIQISVFFTHSIHLKLNTLGLRREELMLEVSLTGKMHSAADHSASPEVVCPRLSCQGTTHQAGQNAAPPVTAQHAVLTCLTQNFSLLPHLNWTRQAYENNMPLGCVQVQIPNLMFCCRGTSYELDVNWLWTGYKPDMNWMWIGYELDMNRKWTGCELIMNWIWTGYKLDVNWLWNG